MSTVTLTPTDTQQCMTVMIEDDSVLEETESLTVSLSLIGVLDSVELSQHTTTIDITDDDGNRIDILVTLFHFARTMFFKDCKPHFVVSINLWMFSLNRSESEVYYEQLHSK